jgi:hypothetical protein
MTEIQIPCELLHSPSKESCWGDIIYRPRPQQFLYLQRNTQAPKRYKSVTKTLHPRVETLHTMESVTGLIWLTLIQLSM